MRPLVSLVAAGIMAGVIAAGWWLWTPDKSLAELEPKYLAARSDYVTVGDLRMHVRDTGPKTAPAIILIHGFGASLHTWEPWARALAAHYRVIRFDVPGFGLTGADPSGDYSDQRSIAVLAALMDRLDVPRATIVGNSMGGRIAWRFAAAHPERVARLVLMAPDGFAAPGATYGTRTTVPATMHAMRFILPKSMLAPNLAVAYATPNFMTPALLDRYYDLMLAPGVRGAILQRMEQSTLVRPEPLLRSIEAETLVLWGDRDGMIPVSNAADYMRHLRHATLVTLPGIGHLPHEEAPEASLAPLIAFLARP